MTCFVKWWWEVRGKDIQRGIRRTGGMWAVILNYVIRGAGPAKWTMRRLHWSKDSGEDELDMGMCGRRAFQAEGTFSTKTIRPKQGGQWHWLRMRWKRCVGTRGWQGQVADHGGIVGHLITLTPNKIGSHWKILSKGATWSDIDLVYIFKKDCFGNSWGQG